MKNVVFTKSQEENISKETRVIMCDEIKRQEVIVSYFTCPQDLNIFQLYALEFIIKRLGEYEFNKGYFNMLERYAGDNLSYKSYEDYNIFIERWRKDAMFRTAMREKFERNDIGYLPHSVLAAYRIIQQSENYMNRQNSSQKR